MALRMVPEQLWEPLDDRAKANVGAYLLDAYNQEFVANNWQFFRVLIGLGLEQCGVAFDRGLSAESLDTIDSYYLDNGWYRDGQVRQADHYVPFALHLYGLLYAKLQTGDDARAERLIERARLFAGDFRHWFDEEGGALAFGRSLTYRYAMGALWGGLALAGAEALPWGEIKGYYLRHLRWWAKQPIAHRDGVLSIGYGYPNLMMSESYNSAGSPYWAFKAFLPLALPADHPFWTAEERPAAFDSQPVPLRHPGMVMMHTAGNVVALSSGQQNGEFRAAAEKYAKFAYSSRYAFSVEVNERSYELGSFDNMLALSDDGRHFRVREDNAVARIARDVLFAVWHPWRDVRVETWLVPASPWHIRIHRISTPRKLHGTEGGFALALPEDERLMRRGVSPGYAAIQTPTDCSAIADYSRERMARPWTALPNSNLIAAQTVVPQLRGEIRPGVTILTTAAVALPAGPEAEAVMRVVRSPPRIDELEALFAQEGFDVSVMRPPGGA